MICRNCGKEIQVVSRVCPHCYSRIYDSEIVNKPVEKKEAKLNYVLLVKSSVIPFYGLIKYFASKENDVENSNTYLGGFLINIILFLGLIFLIAIGIII